MTLKTALKRLTDIELADRIERSNFDLDGIPTAAREALVRLLRKTG